MLKVLSSILCDLDPKVKVIGQKAGICDGVPSTSALVLNEFGHVIQCIPFARFKGKCHVSLIYNQYNYFVFLQTPKKLWI